MATKRATPRNTTRPRRKAKADTAQIVGEAAKIPDIPARWRSYYEKLIAMRKRLTREQHELIGQANEDKQTPLRDHLADAGTDSYDQDFALSIASSEQDALFEIEEALNRIKTGRYGVCEATGKQIPRERLDAVPWTRFTAEVERDLEKNNAVEHSRLGELHGLPRTSRTEPDEEEAPE